jgi:TRAP-type C4-dicarboxylate transport system permease small subunit
VTSEFFVSTVRKASALAGILSAAMIGVSILVVCELVFVRYFLDAPTTWQTELVTYLLVGATLIGSPYVLMIRGHVSVDLLPHYLSPKAREWLSLAGAVAGMFFCTVLLVSGLELWYDAWTGGWLSETVWSVPLWIPYSALPIGFGLMLLQYLADVLQARKGRETT